MYHILTHCNTYYRIVIYYVFYREDRSRKARRVATKASGGQLTI